MKPAALVLLLVAIAGLVVIGYILMSGGEEKTEADPWERRRKEGKEGNTSRVIVPGRRPMTPAESPKPS